MPLQAIEALLSLSTESFAVLAMVAILVALLAYLFARLQAGHRVAQIQEALTVSVADKRNLEDRLASVQADAEEAAAHLRKLELDFERTKSATVHTNARINQLETELRTALSRLNQTTLELAEASQARVKADTELVGEVDRVEQLRQALSEQDAELRTERGRHAILIEESTRQQTAMEERERSFTQQLAHFEQQKKALSEQFRVVANEVLESKSKALQENSNLSVSAILNPFKQSIDSFKKEVQEIHTRESQQRGELKGELAALKELNQQITQEAHELSTALRGQKKLQGNWGELVLENVLDRSGLQAGRDYQREVSINTDEGRLRPDAIVYLPQEKHLVIDAKVSLNAYTRYVNAEDESERKVALREHVEAVGNRIKELADKDYYKLPGLNSPEMVFMFIPIESAFVEALKADESLFQSAIENNVLVATPTTLLTSLNIVRQLWRYEDQNKHTVALAQKAEGVFKKLNAFLGSFEDIRKGLERAQDAYVRAEGQLVSGRANLVKQVGEFRQLAPAIKAELPTYFIEKAKLEIDYIPAEVQSGPASSSEKSAPDATTGEEHAHSSALPTAGGSDDPAAGEPDPRAGHASADQ